jgi:hypothetical protein
MFPAYYGTSKFVTANDPYPEPAESSTHKLAPFFFKVYFNTNYKGLVLQNMPSGKSKKPVWN